MQKETDKNILNNEVERKRDKSDNVIKQSKYFSVQFYS